MGEDTGTRTYETDIIISIGGSYYWFWFLQCKFLRYMNISDQNKKSSQATVYIPCKPHCYQIGDT